MAYNPYIVVPLATWAVAQIAKFAIASFKGDINFRNLYASGGMPSVHAAVVCALATTAYLLSGVNSPIFGVTAVFAAIVLYDSLGVRRSAGEQAVALNMVIDSLEAGKVRLDRTGLRVREALGHTPLQVICGAILGIVLGGVLNYEKLKPLTDWLQVTPVKSELYAYAAVFGLIIIGGWIAKLVLSMRYKKSKTMRSLSLKILTVTQTIGWLGVIAVVFAYERASYAAWRFWPTVLLLIGIVWGSYVGYNAYKTVPTALAQEATQARKAKWFNFGSKSKKRK